MNYLNNNEKKTFYQMTKEHSQEMNELLKREHTSQDVSLLIRKHKEEQRRLMNNDDDFVFEMFLFTMNNVEFLFHHDDERVLEYLNIKEEELNNDKRLLSIYEKSREQYLNDERIFNY